MAISDYALAIKWTRKKKPKNKQTQTERGKTEDRKK